MPPAAKNPFVKGFLDLPKFFIRYFSLPYFLALLPVSSRFTKIGGGFRGKITYLPPIFCHRLTQTGSLFLSVKVLCKPVAKIRR
jgi:hypothetical protein